MPLILGAGTGGRRIIINLWQNRHTERRPSAEQTLDTLGGRRGAVPVLLRDDNKHDEDQDAHGPEDNRQGEWKD